MRLCKKLAVNRSYAWALTDGASGAAIDSRSDMSLRARFRGLGSSPGTRWVAGAAVVVLTVVGRLAAASAVRGFF